MLDGNFLIPTTTLYDSGYSRSLIKDDTFYDEIPKLQSRVTDGINPANIMSGGTVSNLFVTDDQLQSTNFVSGFSGWRLGPTSAEFIDVIVSGILTAGQIHIPDQNTTVSSFHVQPDGDTWWGATETNFNSNPSNAAAYILKTGAARFSNIAAVGGTIGGFTLSTTTFASGAVENTSAISLSTSGIIRVGSTGASYITIDGANQRIRSSNYAAGPLGSGFTLEPDLLEIGNIRARGKITTSVFEKDTISSVGGKLIVANADILNADMTALDASTLTILGDTTFTAGDVLIISDGVDQEYMSVTSAASAPVYTVTRDLAGSYSANNNPIWKKGTCVSVFGNGSTGGWLYMTGSGTNSPYYAIVRRTGSAYNAYSEYARFGNLNGFIDYVTNIYGFAVGTSTDFISIDPTNNLRINTTTSEAITVTGGGSIKMNQGGSINFTFVNPPDACTATLIATGTGNIENYPYSYIVTFITSNGETNVSIASATVTVDDTHKQVSITNIPVSLSSLVTGRKLYRGIVGEGGFYKLLTTINDNTTTTYTDNTANGDLGELSDTRRDNTTAGRIRWKESTDGTVLGGADVFFTGLSNISLGSFSLSNLTIGYRNTSLGHSAMEDLTTGYENVSIGYFAFNSGTTGTGNVFIGTNAGILVTTGSDNVSIGNQDYDSALVTGSKNVFIGARAGGFETGSNKLHINSSVGYDLPPLVYGEFSQSGSAEPLFRVNGEFQITGRFDGWVAAGGYGSAQTWTYASATTITVSSGATSKYSVGDKIKLTQTTVKYFYVVAVANTLLTVTGGSDYTVANAAITLPYYSKIENPQGFPHFFNWTPGFGAGFSVNPVVTFAKFIVVGRLATIQYADDSNGTSNGTGFTITGLPVTPTQTMEFPLMTSRNGGAILNTGLVVTTTSTTLNLYIDHLGNAWTNSSSKGAGYFTLIVEI